MLSMCLQPCPMHSDDRACQEVTQSDKELLCFAGVSERLCAVNLDQGIDWPVNPQIKLTASMVSTRAAIQPQSSPFLTNIWGMAHHNMQIHWVLYGYVHQLSSTMPNQTIVGPISCPTSPNQSQLVGQFGCSDFSCLAVTILQKKKQVDRHHPVCGNPPSHKFWFAKSDFLELVSPTAPTPEF